MNVSPMFTLFAPFVVSTNWLFCVEARLKMNSHYEQPLVHMSFDPLLV